MSDPTRLPEDEQARATLQAQTEEINRLERLLSQHGQSAQSLAEIEEPAATREKLFSRTTLFGWAFGTLVVVFVIRMILPAVFETVKSEVSGHLREPSGNTAAPVIAPTPPTMVIPAPPVPGAPAPPAATVAPAPEAGATVIKIVKKR